MLVFVFNSKVVSENMIYLLCLQDMRSQVKKAKQAFLFKRADDKINIYSK